MDHVYRFTNIPIGSPEGFTIQMIHDSPGIKGEDVGSMTFPISDLVPNTMISDWFMLSSPHVSVRVPIKISLHFCCNKASKFEAPLHEWQFPLPQTHRAYVIETGASTKEGSDADNAVDVTTSRNRSSSTMPMSGSQSPSFVKQSPATPKPAIDRRGSIGRKDQNLPLGHTHSFNIFKRNGRDGYSSFESFD